MSFTRTPVILWTDTAKQGPAETYGFAGSVGVVLEGQLLRGEAASETLYVFMHPTSTLHLLPLPEALAAGGRHVLCAASRYPKNDAALIMEKVLLDLGAWMRWAREEAGYAKVVLFGWSGGGSLALTYQAEAEHPTITSTPAGDPVSMIDAGLLPADGLILCAAHLSRAETLTEWMDPSVLDQSDPYRLDPELDIYADDPVHRPPYDADFVKFFRAANTGPVGLARFTTLRSWLSQWSLEGSQARGAENASRITRTPVLQIVNSADDAVPATHNPLVAAALRSPDTRYEVIPGATHYYQGQPEHLARCLELVLSWSAQRSFDAGN